MNLDGQALSNFAKYYALSIKKNYLFFYVACRRGQGGGISFSKYVHIQYIYNVLSPVHPLNVS